jgi:CHASE2 domain-containing sensor protein
LLLAVVGYGFFVFHGLSSHLNPWSQALINAAAKFAYPDDGQKAISVLLFREENLAELGTHYPVPYKLHAEVIEALASYNPKAVFIDFAFVDKRDDKRIKELSDALCTLHDSEQKPNIFMAAPVLEDGSIAITKELLDCVIPVTPEMDGKTGESGVLTYFNGREPDRKTGTFIPSAAFALASDRIGPASKDSEKLEIVWGKGIAPLNRKWMDCRERSDWALIQSVLSDNPSANKLACPYHRTISVSHLLNSAGDKDIEGALQGKTVFYGAGFRFTGDRVESPVYGEMPGVYLHAMAYDNLLTFGPDYKRAERHGWRVKIIDGMLLAIAAWLLVFVPGEKPSESGSLIKFLKSARANVLGLLAAILIMLAAIHWGGLDVACLTGAALYLVFRIGVQRDRAFAILAFLTLSTTIFCYTVLNLGPRNILAFLAFFEIVGHAQELAIKRAETYFAVRQHYADNNQRALSARWARWDRVLGSIFLIFHQPETHLREP